MKEYLEESMSFSEYDALIERLVEEEKTTGPKQSEILADFTKLNFQRMNRIAKTAELGKDPATAVRSNEREQKWLIITEAWCGDAAQNIPIIEKLASESDIIETRYILRDENPELIDRFLTFGARAIPKVIALDAETMEILWTWGARPKAAQKKFFEMKENGDGKPAIMEEMQRWYNEDKGRSVQHEFSELLRGVGGRKTAGAGA